MVLSRGGCVSTSAPPEKVCKAVHVLGTLSDTPPPPAPANSALMSLIAACQFDRNSGPDCSTSVPGTGTLGFMVDCVCCASPATGKSISAIVRRMRLSSIQAPDRLRWEAWIRLPERRAEFR